MGIADDAKASFGEDFFDRKTERATEHVWHEVCMCGHLDRYHAPSIGGSYRLPADRTQTVRGETVTTTTVFGGCVGAVKVKGFEEETLSQTGDRTATRRINPTCPCTEFRAVARVDRPNRYFNQRMPTDREDYTRHPFAVGIRALMTHLSKRKAAQTDADWAYVEFNRRLLWLDGARVCGAPRCKETDDVWPVFLPEDRDRSELRCSKHR